MALFFAFAVIVLATFAYFWWMRESSVEGWLRGEREKIDFTFAGIKPSLETRLALRAQANARLLSVFEIVNSLTTTSPKHHQDFLRVAARIVNDSQNGGRTRWTNLYRVAEGFLRQEIKTSDGRIPLEDCAQRLCLTVVLVDNFGVESTSIPSSTARCIAQEINRQWLLSKCNPDASKSEVLGNAIRSLGLKQVQGDDDERELTPEEILAIIMPQYETLWRVVLLGFVTAYHRQRRPAVVKRGWNVPDCLGDRIQEAEAVKLAMEALRLYPSNKTIYRASLVCTDAAAKTKATTVKADVERCHRDASIWGADAIDFRPERFDSLSALQKDAYLPFSLGRHRCPAINGFGNRMITMLLVALGRTLSAEVGRVRFGDDRLDQDNKAPLPTGRGDMGRWVFELGSV